MEVVTDFLFLGSKITADGDRSHETIRQLLLGREAMTNLDSVLKSRDITLLTKVRIAKAAVFPGVTYGCESWTIKKVECQRTDAFNCGAGEDPWTARDQTNLLFCFISWCQNLGQTSQSEGRSTLNIHWKD